MKHTLSILTLLAVLTLPLQAQQLKGLSLTVDAGLMIPNAKQAEFYRGLDGYPNTINRVLHSQQYGIEIWNRLVNEGLISPSAIPSYSALQVVEYGKMDFRLTYQIGVGIRYDYPSGFGWLLRFDFSQLTAAGQFQLSSNNGTGILGSNQYVTCDIYGQEKRIFIDLGLTRRFTLSERLDLELDLGFDLNNTKVTNHAIRIPSESSDISILDIWGGRTPDVGTGTYEYVNQGGIGIGGFGTLALSYKFRGAAVDVGYTASYTQTKYTDFNDDDCFALQHTVLLRFHINNFSFFGK